MMLDVEVVSIIGSSVADFGLSDIYNKRSRNDESSVVDLYVAHEC